MWANKVNMHFFVYIYFFFLSAGECLQIDFIIIIILRY